MKCANCKKQIDFSSNNFIIVQILDIGMKKTVYRDWVYEHRKCPK